MTNFFFFVSQVQAISLLLEQNKCKILVVWISLVIFFKIKRVKGEQSFYLFLKRYPWLEFHLQDSFSMIFIIEAPFLQNRIDIFLIIQFKMCTSFKHLMVLTLEAMITVRGIRKPRNSQYKVYGSSSFSSQPGAHLKQIILN